MLPTQLRVAARMLTVESAYNGFLLHLSRFAPKTRLNYAGVIRQFLATLPETCKVTQINCELIERFILAKNYKASSRNVRLFTIRSFLSWVETIHGIPSAAKKVEPLKKSPPRQRILSQEEYRKIVKATSGHIKDCIELLANTGLRAAEFMALTKENLNGEFITIIGKGGKRRAIPINRTIKSILENDPTMKFLKSKSNHWLWRLCQKAAKAAGIKPFYPHSLRHYFADQLHINGCPIGTICKLMGHSSPLTTAMIYIHWQDADLAGTTDVLDL
jgi:integrase